MDADVSKALSFPEIRYSHVWEDYRTLSKALHIRPNDTLLCITSSGENVLNLLLEEPRKIVALDMSTAQSSLLELKLAGIRCLCHTDFLVLLSETEDREGRWDEIYTTVRVNGQMPSYAQQYWDVHYESFKSCGSWLGKFEKYLAVLTRDHLPTALSSEQIDSLFSAQSLEEQREIFDNWPLDNLKEVYCQYTSPKSQLARKGRDLGQLKYVQISDKQIEEMFWAKLVRSCRDVPVRDNFYLSWLLRGQRGYDPLTSPEYAPPCLTREGFDKLQGLVDRVAVHTGALEDYFAHTSHPEKPTKFALSNIFEYMSQEAADRVFDTLAANMERGGRIAYWELFSPRQPTMDSEQRQRLQSKAEECEALRSQDRTLWFMFHVLEVK